MLQYVAVCIFFNAYYNTQLHDYCRTFSIGNACVAVCCTVLHVLQYVAVCIFCNCVLHVLHVLQCVAVCIFCNCVLCVAVCCSMLQCVHFVVPVGGLPRRPVLRGRV